MSAEIILGTKIVLGRHDRVCDGRGIRTLHQLKRIS
jgi:hypothetical protein